MTLTVRPLIHDVDPYVDLNWHTHVVDRQGWNSDSAVFESMISQFRPNLVCEVGSWKGASAITMAEHVKRYPGGLPPEIVCVDTWLGSREFWSIREHKNMLRLRNGYPTVYETFLKNVAAEGWGRVITPFPATSMIAGRFFHVHVVKFDLTYIDGSHDFGDVYDDIMMYAPLSKVLFGDDYDWESVREAVDKCALNLHKKVHVIENKWIFE